MNKKRSSIALKKLSSRRKMRSKTFMSEEDRLRKKIMKELVLEDKCAELVLPLIQKEPAYRERIMENAYLQVAKFMKPLKKKSRPKANYFPELHIQDYRKYENNLEGLHKAFYDTLLMIKGVTNADDAYLYLSEDNNIYRYYDTECNSYARRWPIAPGTIVAAFVAHSQECLMLSKSTLTSDKYPLGLGRKGLPPNAVISVPAITPDKKVLAVFEYTKRNPDSYFSKEELNYAIATGAWMSAALTRKQAKHQLMQIKAYNWRLLKYLKYFLNGKLDIDSFVSMCMMSMKDCVKAEEVVYFSRIADSKLEIQVFKEDSKTSQKLVRSVKKISWALSDEIFKKAIASHEVINVHGSDISKYHPKNGDSKILKSVLCVPVGTHMRTLGVVKVINKVDAPNFNADDEMLASSAAVYCASALFYAAIAGQLANMQEVVRRQKQVLSFHLSPCSHDVQLFKSRQLIKPPANYIAFSWYPALNELDHLTDFSYWMFKDLFEGDPVMDNFHFFILMCKKGYREKPYHNFEHAFHAAHCMFCIIRSAQQKFTYLEQLALMVAMICHDIDHPGFTNNYMRQISHDLSILYRDSFLENHHSNITKILINESNLFAHLNPSEFKTICDEIHSLIMATDLKLYFRKKVAIMELLKQGIFNESLADHKNLMKKLMMTACDLSGQCKPFKITQRLTFNLYKELYKEGDKLRVLGMEPLAVMDRNNYMDIPSDQVHFLTEVVLPCTLVLSQIIPETKDLYILSSAVCDTWKTEKGRRTAQAVAMASHQTASEIQAASFMKMKRA